MGKLTLHIIDTNSHFILSIKIDDDERGVYALSKDLPDSKTAISAIAAFLTDTPEAALAAWRKGKPHKAGDPWYIQPNLPKAGKA